MAVEVTRETEDSKFVQTISLAAGDAGNRVEFGNVIDWKTKAAALKATFPLTAANPKATYNWDWAPSNAATTTKASLKLLHISGST